MFDRGHEQGNKGGLDTVSSIAQTLLDTYKIFTEV